MYKSKDKVPKDSYSKLEHFNQVYLKYDAKVEYMEKDSHKWYNRYGVHKFGTCAQICSKGSLTDMVDFYEMHPNKCTYLKKYICGRPGCCSLGKSI